MNNVIGGFSSQRQPRFERATRSLATFVRSHRSLRSLAPKRSALLRSLHSLTLFTCSLTHFAHSLAGRLKLLNMCSRWDRVQRDQTRFSSSQETRPEIYVIFLLQQIEEYFDNLPRNKVPKIGSTGERYREKQLLIQMPRQDLYRVSRYF